jgi:hypothetical protein
VPLNTCLYFLLAVFFLRMLTYYARLALSCPNFRGLYGFGASFATCFAPLPRFACTPTVKALSRLC